MSAQPSFGSEISGIKIQPILSLHFDITKGGPVPKKVAEILKAKEKRPDEDIGGIISEVAEANKCQTLEYKRRGPRRVLWGLYEAGPEEKVSISIKGHFCK